MTRSNSQFISPMRHVPKHKQTTLQQLRSYPRPPLNTPPSLRTPHLPASAPASRFFVQPFSIGALYSLIRPYADKAEHREYLDEVVAKIRRLRRSKPCKVQAEAAAKTFGCTEIVRVPGIAALKNLHGRL